VYIVYAFCYNLCMITFNTRNFRMNLRKALDYARDGKDVFIERNGTIYVVKLFVREKSDEQKSD
jgi:hypothetical protein